MHNNQGWREDAQGKAKEELDSSQEWHEQIHVSTDAKDMTEMEKTANPGTVGKWLCVYESKCCWNKLSLLDNTCEYY